MAQANIVVLLVALVLVGVSLFLGRKKKWVWHGNSMTIVMIVTVLLVVAHMGPSFVSATKEAIEALNVVALVGTIHGVIGAVGLALGVWLVWIWSVNESSSTQFCAPRKKLMWKILAIWLLSLSMGGLYYVLHITFG
jgi:hypothetical protein